ncbi:suppressor of fused domain protein [Actinokineospora diospyrosa]|uniref:Suppressor of fused protein (SUFU) n=1 Tax=Actinokineospora diospyrosa TaxID=103728 RepID=A0ABT1IEK3_9PSEU|nr:suppressor of fused domain protein [Actinokineospora diospyrosa]MCP2271040.1 Suppressor of fused protein (SUFU) [Actinokineospora diospyrosa]
MAERDTPQRLANYLARLNSMTEVVPELHEMRPRVPNDGRVLAVVYTDVPEPGYVTGFTYGLSLIRPSGGREISITVRSGEVEWAKVPARSVAVLRGLNPLDPGHTIGYAGALVEGSPLHHLLLSERNEPWHLDPIALPGEDPVEILGAFPTHDSETDFVRTHGVDALWRLDWDRYDPLRPPVV